MRIHLGPTAIGAAAVGLTTMIASIAHADPPLCSSLAGPPLVYIENGDTQEALVKRLGYRLANSTDPVRLVYKNEPTCTLALDMYVPNQMINDVRPIRYIPTAAEDPTFTALSVPPVCTADTPGTDISLGIGATFLSGCTAQLTGHPKPADLFETTGPVEPYGFIVPQGSSQIAITAQEGYFAFGFTQATGMAMPWIDQSQRFVRSATASTALATSAAIGLLASQFKGTITANNLSSEVLNFVATSATPEAAIGIMGGDISDGNRNLVKILAFKAFNQRYAYFPDSSSTSFDKRNVRDGHYLPWAPTPYLTRVDVTTNKAVDPNVQRIIDLVLGVRFDTDVNGVDQVIASGLIPQCAMGVTRSFDGADLSLYPPPESCACYFEAHAPGGSTTCKLCPSGTCASGGVCRRGFCEVR
jgi:hypothetical protein